MSEPATNGAYLGTDHQVLEASHQDIGEEFCSRLAL
jgi:hypothetical protein